MVINYLSLDGKEVNFSNRAVQANYFGSWMSTAENKTDAASIVSWCDTRIAKYEQWIKECKNLKEQYQEKLIEGLSPEILLARVSAKDLERALAAKNQVQ